MSKIYTYKMVKQIAKRSTDNALLIVLAAG